jgi:hypothetical protein
VIGRRSGEIGAEEKVRDVIRKKIASVRRAEDGVTENRRRPRARLTAVAEDTAALREQAKNPGAGEVREKRGLADLDEAVSSSRRRWPTGKRRARGDIGSPLPPTWTIATRDHGGVG